MAKMRASERRVVASSVEVVCELLQCDRSSGLTSLEVARRREIFGWNEVEQDEPEHACRKLLNQLKEPLILLLFASALISLCLGQYDDAVSIALAVMIVTGVAFAQELRSEESLKALASLVPPKATVLRDGQMISVFARELVPGDAVEVAAGARVPADCRVVEARDSLVDESSLSGESEPVRKVSELHSSSMMATTSSSTLHVTVDDETSTLAIADCKTTLFLGTFAKRGRCRGIVVATGASTEFGRAALDMKDLGPQRTPLQQGMDTLGKRLSFVSICVIAFIGLAGIARGEKMLDVFTIGVSLAVAAIPEGLPICVAVTLALGVMRMARRNAVVKRLPAVEALGCADVLCVDKTGTLTVNEMTLQEVYCPSSKKSLRRIQNGSFVVVGDSSFDDKGEDHEASSHGHQLLLVPEEVALTFDAAVVCSDAHLSGELDVGLPTEVAILRAARELHLEDRRPLLDRICEVPFTSESKRMDVVVEPKRNNNARAAREPRVTFVKGAYEALRTDLVEVVDDNSFLPISADLDASILAAAADLANRGLRVVAVARSYDSRREKRRRTPRKHQKNNGNDNTSRFGLPLWRGSLRATAAENNDDHNDDSESDEEDDELNFSPTKKERMASSEKFFPLVDDATEERQRRKKKEPLVLLGLLALSDPARPSAKAAVGALQERGIRVVMLTGDGRETARAIARDVGILSALDAEGAMDASGADIDRWVQVDEVSAQLSRGMVVVHRVSPRHKLEIVRALQRAGSVVAMTGDGVNDAPALRAADIGISMGGPRGTDVATEAADVVLTDDDVLSIVAAVDEGKAIFHNIRNFITFQLSTSFAALGLVALAHLLDLPSPLNAMQVLWINIIMDGPPAQSLGTEAVDATVTRSLPRPRHEPIVTERIFIRVLTSAMLICAGTLAVFSAELGDAGYWETERTKEEDEGKKTPDAPEDENELYRRARTMTFTTFVIYDMFNALACRSDTAIVCTRRLRLFSNPAFCAAVGGSLLGQLAVIYWGPLQSVFQTAPLSAFDLIKVLTVASSVVVLDVARKINLFGFRGGIAMGQPENDKGNKKAGQDFMSRYCFYLSYSLGSRYCRSASLWCRAYHRRGGPTQLQQHQLDHVI